MISDLRSHLAATLNYLGDAAHRRFVATIVALAATHLLGKALDADSIANALEIAIGGLGGAWSGTTPKIAGSE